MSTERAWPFPASRPLANWWRQLTRWQPCSLWIAHLLLHRIEALVTVQQSCLLDPFDRLVLKAIPLSSRLDELAGQLRLGRQHLTQVVRGLQAAGLVTDQWGLTPLGQEAVTAGQYDRATRERRSFTFLHHDPPGPPPHFLSLTGDPATPWPADADWSFDPAVLEACIRRSDEWKGRVGFPLDVRNLVRLDGGAEALERLVIDRPEKLPTVLILTGDRLIGFPMKEDGWSLQSEAPLFELVEWQEAFPELAEPSAEEWHSAWDEWCQSRKLTIEGPIELHTEGHLLRVKSSQPLREQFGKRSDVLKGEAWLLAGRGRVRRGVVVEIMGT